MKANEMSPGARALLDKLEVFTALDPFERRTLFDLLDRREQSVGRGQDLVAQGAARSHGYLILNGWIARSKTLSDGRRQILSFLMPGDLTGAFTAVSERASSSLTALNAVTVVPFKPAALVATIAQAPRLGAALVWAATREQEILAEHLVSLGRRSARERVAHLFLELWSRLRVRGLDGQAQLQVPLTQHLIADTLGLSVVHVNRTVRQLAAEGLLSVKRESVTLLDIAHLHAVAGFDAAYLMHHAMPAELDAELTRLAAGDAS
jgi:CRP-like cAMP-binding protein